MARKSRSPALVSDCLYVAHCSPDLAVAWLASRPVTRSTVTGTIDTPRDCHLPEYILLRRRDPFINLGLARHGRSTTVLGKLYESGCPNMQAVLAGNGSLFEGDKVSSHNWQLPFTRRRAIEDEIVEHGPLPVLRALMANPDLRSEFYKDLFTRWKPTFDPAGRTASTSSPPQLPEDRYRALVGFLAENPRMHTAREDSAERYYYDGLSESEYDAAAAGAWQLAAEVPVLFEWAEALALLYRKLHKPYDCLADVEGTIERWHVRAQRGPDPYREVRAALCSKFVDPYPGQLQHEDPACRDAFFRTFDPDARQFADLDWNGFATLEPNWGYHVFENPKVWASKRGREKFRDALWNATSRYSDLSLVGFFNERLDQEKLKHPEWFAEDEDASPPLARSEQIETLRSEVRQLISSMQEQAKSKLMIAGVFVAGMIVGLFF